MANDDGPSARLANFIGTVKNTALAPGLEDKAATCLLDALGLALAARDEKTVQAYISLSQPLADGVTGCRIWGRTGTVSVLDAVTANALAAHARFQDDCDMMSWAHPGSLIVPVAVGLGELMSSSVADVLRGILCGYTTLNWLGASEAVGRAVVERGFRTSPTLGPVASAAAASVLLGLSPGHARQAIGIAADSTGGVLEPVRAGSADWRVQNATAAHRGTLAALLAARGIDGPALPLEGPSGFLRAFAGMSEPPPAWSEDPDPRSVLTVWAKPYPTLGDNIAVVSTALSLREQITDPALIEEVTVRQNAHFASYPGTSYRGPFSQPGQGMASTAFVTAAALLYGPIRYSLYSANLNDPAIASLIEVITIVPESEYGYLDAAIEVKLSDGRTITKSASELPRGLFFRDRDSAAAAFVSLLREAAYPAGFAQAVPQMVLDPAGRADLPIRAVIDEISEIVPAK